MLHELRENRRFDNGVLRPIESEKIAQSAAIDNIGHDRRPLLAIVDRLDERVGRQPAVRLAEVHRPAGRDDADAELLRGVNLRLDQAGDAARRGGIEMNAHEGRCPGFRSSYATVFELHVSVVLAGHRDVDALQL